MSYPDSHRLLRRAARTLCAAATFSLSPALLAAVVPDSAIDAPQAPMQAFSITSSSASLNGGYPFHRGKSPFSFADFAPPSDSFVVNDRDSSSMDIYMPRQPSGSEIVIPINIRRYVGDVDKLRANNLLGEKLAIFLPVYDVDSSTPVAYDCDGDGITEQFNPEVDEVYFNGEKIGVLRGQNNVWRLQAFEVDIAKVNFPTSPGGVGSNELRIEIDTANADVPLSGGGVGCKVWYTEADWVGVRFEDTSPVVLVPGLFGNPGSLQSSGYAENIAAQTGLPAEVVDLGFNTWTFKACSVGGTSIVDHASELRTALKEVMTKYGSDGVHLIGHSKGGLTARHFIYVNNMIPLEVPVYPMSGDQVIAKLKTPTLVSHGSPHLGTVLADALSIGFGVIGLGIGNVVMSDLCDLTPKMMADYHTRHPSIGPVAVVQIAPDADTSGDGELDAAETAGNQVTNLTVANYLYNLLGDIERLEVEFVPNPVIVKYHNETFLGNDTMVTVTSSGGLPGAVIPVSANHGTVVAENAQNIIIEAAKGGSLPWRKQ
jgi:hypothetical protein